MDPISFLTDKVGDLNVDDYEICRIDVDSFSAQAKEGEVELTEEAKEQGIALRLFKGARSAFACSSDFTPAYLEKMVRLASQSLEMLEDSIRFELPSGKMTGNSVAASIAPKDVKVAMVLELEKEAVKFDPRIKRVRDARYSEETKRVILKNSRGLDMEHTSTGHQISVMVVAEENGDQQMAWEDEFSDKFSGLDPKKTARMVAEKSVALLGAKPIPTQQTPVVLDSVVVASLLGVLASSFLGEQVLKNRSALRDRLGEKIYSEKVTIVDDGNLPGGYTSFPFDGEGTLTKENRLVEKGVLKSFLYDSRFASEAKTAGTGNSIRPHFKEPPRVGATNFFIRAGSGSLEELLSKMGKGFWIRDLIGVHTADPITGDFSLGATGIWVENGKRTPVRGVTVSGNLHSLFKNVIAVGGDVRFYHSYGAPPLMINLLDIGGM